LRIGQLTLVPAAFVRRKAPPGQPGYEFLHATPMNFFWDNVFEYFKERRLAALFFGTLGIFFAGLLLLTVFYQTTSGLDWLSDWPLVVPGLALLLAALIWRAIRLTRMRKLNRYQSSPLSRDELAKARSKLRRKQS
jgi:cobalamin biosynthesis protein CobD/CbiB